MAPPDKVQPLDLTSDAAQKTAQDSAAETSAADKAKEAPDQRETALKGASETMRQKVAIMQGVLTMAGKPIDEPTQRYLEQYFQGAINRFDKDRDNKISEKEAGEFREAMLKKTGEIVQGMVEGAKEAKKMSAAAEKAEKIDAGAAKKALEGVKDLGDVADLVQANAEIQNMQTQNDAFQQSVQTQLTSVQQFAQSYNSFQQASQGFGHFEDMWNAVFNGSERSAAIAKMKQSLEDTRNGVNTLLEELKAKQKTLDANSEKIKAAFAKARADAIRERDAKKAEIEKAKTEQAEQIETRKKQYEKLAAEKKKMEERRKGIEERQSRSAQIQRDWKRQEEDKKTDVQKKNCGEETQDIAAELSGFEMILENPDVPSDYKDKIRPEYEKAKARQKHNRLALEVIDQKEKSGAEFSQKLDDDQKKAAEELRTADSHLQRQRETETSLQQNIDTLNDLQLQYATNAEEVDKYYNEKIDLLDKHTVAVDDFVLNSSMARQQSIGALEQAKTSLAGLSVEAKGFWDFVNPFEAVGSFSKGVGGLLHAGAQWIDKNVRDVLAMTRNSDSVFEQGIYYGTQFLSVFTGFVSGALELGGGIFTLTGGLVSDIGSVPWALVSMGSTKMHFETFAGLGAIIGYDAAKGEFSWEKLGEAWGGMGKAIIGYGENWGYHTDPATGKEEWRDEYGTGLGKTAFNVLSLFIGVGEAKAAGTAAAAGNAAAKAGSAVGKASLAAEAARLAVMDAAKAAGKSAGMFTGRGAQMAAFAKTFVSGLKPGFITKAAREGSLTTGAVSKTLAVTGSVAGSAVKAVGKGLSKGFNVIRHPLKSTYTVLKTAGKITYEIAVLPYKLAWGVAKSFKNVGTAFGRVGRGLTDPRAMLAARASERMGKAAKVMEQYGDDFARAQESLKRIIEEDPKLAARAAELDASKMSGPELAKSRLALESEAARKLATSDPQLANAYVRVRKASRELAEEAEGYLAATRKHVEKVKNDPAARTAYNEHEILQANADLEASTIGAGAGKKGKAGKGKARRALDEFENDPVRMGKATEYREALAAEMELPGLSRQVDELGDSLLGRNSDEAYVLAEEINEARAVHAPSDAPAAGTGVTNNPQFARDFIREFQEAYSKRNYAKVEELVDSLGTYREGSELAKTLEGLRMRETLKITPEPPVAVGFKNKFRGDMMTALEEGLSTGNYRAYDAVKGKLYGKNAGLDAYIDWMEDVYKKHPQEARTIIVSDQQGLSAALKANQAESLRVFDDFSKRISDGIDPAALKAQMQGANLDGRWQSALEQMQERLTARNRQTALTADIALNRIRGEYAEIITPEMTAVEAAKRLEQRYRNDSMGRVASGKPGDKVVARDVRLKDGLYELRVMDNGTVRLFDKAGNVVVPPQSLAARVTESVRQRLGKPKAAPAPSPAAPVSPAAAPTPVAPSAPLRPRPSVSTEFRGFETREAKLRSIIEKDSALQNLEGRGDFGRQIARGKAEVRLYRGELRASRVEAELQSLEGKLQTSKTGGVQAEIDAAQQALDNFKTRADYLEYQQFQQTENMLSAAEQALGMDTATFQHLREAQKVLVRDSLMRRMDKSALTAEEAANLLNREKVPPVAGSTARVEDLGTITLKGNEQYTVRLMEDGQFRLINGNGNQVLTSAERALQPVPYEAAELTMESLAKQPANTTVAYGTGSPTGDWVEVTRLGNGKHRVVTVEKGTVTAVIDDVENLRFADDTANAGRQKITWEQQGKAGEYGNVKEVFKPAKYETVNPAAATPTPTAAPAATPAPAPTAAPAPVSPAAPAPTPAAPSGTPKPTPAERMQKALETRREARATIRSGREKIIKLEEQMPRLEQQIEAMKIRKVSDLKIRSAERQLSEMQAEHARLTADVETAAGKIWGTRTDYWKGRLVEKGEAIRNYVGVQRRLDWLKAKSKIIGRVAETAVKGVKALRAPAEYLWKHLREQVEITASTGPKLFLLGQTGHAIANQLDALRQASIASGQYPDLSLALGELTMDQYHLLAEIQKGASRSLGLPTEQEFAALSPEQQTNALRAAYAQLEGAESLNEEALVYTPAQKDYINGKLTLARQTLAGLTLRENLTAEEVAAELDNAFGPQGLNDAQVGYELDVQGVKIKVDKDGKRTYEGIEKWTTAGPTRLALQDAIDEVQGRYVVMTPAELAKANNGKPITSAEDLARFLTDKIREQAVKDFEDKALQMDTQVGSRTVTQEGNPAMSVSIGAAGRVEATVDPAWSQQLLEYINSGENIREMEGAKTALATASPARVAPASRPAASAEGETTDTASETPPSADEEWDSEDPYA